MLLLFDPNAQPQSWNERMKPGEYAILYSGLQPAPPDHQDNISKGSLFCTVFSSLAEAEAYAAQQVTLLPAVRCRIYDHHGLGREAIREIPGSQYKGEKDITPGFRRWVGSILFFGGVGLTILDWCSDFSLSWPAMIGTRVFPVGFVLLVTELVIVIEARRKKRREGWTSQ